MSDKLKAIRKRKSLSRLPVLLWIPYILSILFLIFAHKLSWSHITLSMAFYKMSKLLGISIIAFNFLVKSNIDKQAQETDGVKSPHALLNVVFIPVFTLFIVFLVANSFLTGMSKRFELVQIIHNVQSGYSVSKHKIKGYSVGYAGRKGHEDILFVDEPLLMIDVASRGILYSEDNICDTGAGFYSVDGEMKHIKGNWYSVPLTFYS